MDEVKVERVDHHGVVMGVIRDLGLIERIDALLGCYPDEKVSTGESVAAMIVNGLGFTDRPMTLTPQFFENCPTEVLFRKGVEAQDFNRFKLGRALDRVYGFGCDILFADLARKACEAEGIESRFGHLDTTSFSLTGQYDDVRDAEAVCITHGYSKDHRPDLKQVVLELLVSQDGGVPLVSKVWDGNTSDNEIFQARSRALIASMEGTKRPLYYVADCKLYSASHADSLAKLPFITRIPDSLSLANEKICTALKNPSNWQPCSETKKYQEFYLEHHGIQQRWIVVHSESLVDCSEKSVNKNLEKEKLRIQKELLHLHAHSFACAEDARHALDEKCKKWKWHLLASVDVEEHKFYSGKGRPKKGAKPDKSTYKIHATFVENTEKKEAEQQENSCFVLGSNIPSEALTAEEIINHYRNQQTVEKGFRFLKDPVFFTSSLFLKNNSRIEALLTVMSLALVVYAIAERRLRKNLKEQNETLPNQINKSVQNPTMRWIFQMLDGICRVVTYTDTGIVHMWTGITALRKKILAFFGKNVAAIYGFS